MTRWFHDDSLYFILVNIIHACFKQTDISCIVSLLVCIVIIDMLGALLHSVDVQNRWCILLVIWVNHFAITDNPSIVKIQIYLTTSSSDHFGLESIASYHKYLFRREILFNWHYLDLFELFGIRTIRFIWICATAMPRFREMDLTVTSTIDPSIRSSHLFQFDLKPKYRLPLYFPKFPINIFIISIINFFLTLNLLFLLTTSGIRRNIWWVWIRDFYYFLVIINNHYTKRSHKT